MLNKPPCIIICTYNLRITVSINKFQYIYILTPKGVKEKTKVTINFMKQKISANGFSSSMDIDPIIKDLYQNLPYLEHSYSESNEET